MFLRIPQYLYRAIFMKVEPIRYARALGVEIGEDCRIISPEAATFGSEPYLVRIGNHVTIAGGVRFITHDGGVWVFRQKYPEIDIFGTITIGDNVFIGANTLIMPNVSIGNNCVIGAGAVVTRNVLSGSVAVGVPARTIKTLDEYWHSVQGRSMFIRSMKPKDKREHLVRQLWK